MAFWIVGLGINLALNVAFLPGRGAWVAALASSISYAVLLALHMWLFAREAGGFGAMRPRPREVVRFVRVAVSPQLMDVTPRENVYGHQQRLHWLRDHLHEGDRVVEFGCGTGRLITLPLRAWGFDVTGVDLDARSIEHGRELLREAGLDPEALQTVDLRELPGPFDAVIASEILEHLDDEELRDSLALIHERLVPGGKLLVTTPNGYSLFELENLLWYRTGVDRLYRAGGLGRPRSPPETPEVRGTANGARRPSR